MVRSTLEKVDFELPAGTVERLKQVPDFGFESGEPRRIVPRLNRYRNGVSAPAPAVPHAVRICSGKGLVEGPFILNKHEKTATLVAVAGSNAVEHRRVRREDRLERALPRLIAQLLDALEILKYLLALMLGQRFYPLTQPIEYGLRFAPPVDALESG